MKTFGLLPTQELTSIQFADTDTPDYLVVTISGHRLRIDSLCPSRQFWESHPDAPWNVVIERDPAAWRAEYPESWGETADDDPAAPWNAPEPERDPAAYLNESGDPMLWPMPTIVPLVKLDKPDDDGIHRHEPTLVWFEDRVERQWQSVPLTTEEIAANARKIWPSVTEFWDEFTDAEQYGIEVHTDPEIVVLRAKLKLWLSDVWSDDPRIVMGLAALVSAGIIDETRKAEILAKD